MKIVFVIPDMPGGGTERVVALLSNEYVRKGHSVSIMLFAGTQTAYALDKRVEVVSMAGASAGSVRVRIKRLKNMREYFKRNKGCLIYSFSTIGTGFVVLATIGLSRKMLVSERTEIPAIIKHTGIFSTALPEYWYARRKRRRKVFPDI